MEYDNLLAQHPIPQIGNSSGAEDVVDGFDSSLGYYGALGNNTSSRRLLPITEETLPTSTSACDTPGTCPEIISPHDIERDYIERLLPDLNVYQQRKTLAQGMMDLALLSANATQLRFILESKKTHPYYYVSLFCIAVSICFQIAVGVGLILNCRYNIKNQAHICPANRINNFTIIGIFIITVINVFVSAFAVSEAGVK